MLHSVRLLWPLRSRLLKSSLIVASRSCTLTHLPFTETCLEYGKEACQWSCWSRVSMLECTKVMAGVSVSISTCWCFTNPIADKWEVSHIQEEVPKCVADWYHNSECHCECERQHYQGQQGIEWWYVKLKLLITHPVTPYPPLTGSTSSEWGEWQCSGSWSEHQHPPVGRLQCWYVVPQLLIQRLLILLSGLVWDQDVQHLELMESWQIYGRALKGMGPCWMPV